MDEIRLPFGRYVNTPLPAVPGDYLTRLIRTCKLSSGLTAAVTAELTRRGITPPAARPARKVECSDCGGSPLDCTWLEASNGRRMIRVKCDVCGKNLGFAPMTEPYLGMADRAASPTALLDVLVAAEEEGVPLRNDGKTVEFGDHEAWRRASPELKARLRQVRHTLAGMLPKGVEV